MNSHVCELFLKMQHTKYILAWMDRKNRILALARGFSCWWHTFVTNFEATPFARLILPISCF